MIHQVYISQIKLDGLVSEHGTVELFEIPAGSTFLGTEKSGDDVVFIYDTPEPTPLAINVSHTAH